jgi:hypothetical protein
MWSGDDLGTPNIVLGRAGRKGLWDALGPKKFLARPKNLKGRFGEHDWRCSDVLRKPSMNLDNLFKINVGIVKSLSTAITKHGPNISQASSLGIACTFHIVKDGQHRRRTKYCRKKMEQLFY